MKRLSKSQIEAIRFMRNGYELGRTSGFCTSVWLQKGGCGCGGDTAKIKENTFHSLLTRGLITSTSYKYPTTTFCLTELGETIELI